MTPGACRHCGAAVPAVHYRGLFSATVRPPAVYYDGSLIALTPTRARILAALAATPFVTNAALLELAASVGALQVHLTHIRGVLPAGVSLSNKWGKGYRLVIPGDDG